VDAEQQIAIGQRLEISADGHLGDAKIFAQRSDGHVPCLSHAIEDFLTPLSD